MHCKKVRRGLMQTGATTLKFAAISFLAIIAAIPTGAFAESAVAGALNGAAAIAGAISPIVTAGIQASADKAIAGINAETSLAVTAINSETTKYLAAANAEVALAQAQTSQAINKINNDGQTERLGMQLAEVRAAREDAMAAEREKRWIEMYYNEQRIQLAKEQADANYKLAQATLQAQLVQQGLVSGVSRIDSSAGLTVRRVGSGEPVLASTNSLSRVQGETGTSSVMRGAEGQLTFSGGIGPRNETSRRLLAAALNGESSPEVVRRDREISSVTGMLGASLGQGSTRDIRFRGVASNEPPVVNRAPSSYAGEWRDRSPEAPLTQAGGHSGSRGVR